MDHIRKNGPRYQEFANNDSLRPRNRGADIGWSL